MPFVNGIKAARERIVARNDDDRAEFLRKRGFSKAETAKIIETVLAEEGSKPESVFDFVQGITARRARQAASGRPARPGGPGQEAARQGGLMSVMPEIRLSGFPQVRVSGFAAFRLC